MRFEQMMAERKQSSDADSMNDSELLADIIKHYNAYKANSGIKKWQISPDQHMAIWGVICGLCADARALIRAHLDHNKWEESGAWVRSLAF